MAPLRRLRPENDNDRLEPLEARLDREAAARRRDDEDRASTDLLDVPAAVVCLVCGEADCTGCEDRDQSRSGIVAIVAWERPGASPLTRLWATARSTTRDAESFFELLPDGPVLPALRFAALSELVTVATWVLTVIPVLALVRPTLLTHLTWDPHARSIALRALVFGIPAFAAFMVSMHAAHGLSIDAGAARCGARRARTRALRFGLYACGWDLVMGPVGAVVVAMKEGARAAFGIVDQMSNVPSRATHAFLRGCYRLEGERAKKANATAVVGVVGLTVFAAIAIFVALIAALVI
ncbi:MAG: hypothetical protein KF819_31020 [Labilithrix sp.]|nr:hypothetical protein [Labilithrix sp.]